MVEADISARKPSSKKSIPTSQILDAALQLLETTRPGIRREAWEDFLLSRGAWGKGGNSSYLHVCPDEVIRLAFLFQPKQDLLLQQAWELSTWAASINWRGGENQKEWLDDLLTKIETFQEGYKQANGNHGSGMKSEVLRHSIKYPTELPCDCCRKCERKRIDAEIAEGRAFPTQLMVCCPICRNKRCPKASDHDLVCTGSNEPNQPGSVYRTETARDALFNLVSGRSESPAKEQDARTQLAVRHERNHLSILQGEWILMECPLCKGTGEVRQTAEARPATYIAKILRNARKEAGFTLRDVEVATGLSNAAISQIEAAKIRNPSFHSLVSLYGVYGIQITSLINNMEGQPA